ncbi:MAG: hypothetical protein ACOX41_04355 [Anaerovoracaceae bacterium]
MAELFSRLFFRHYDRKIASGEIVFSRIAISKNDFTQMCTDPAHVPPWEGLELLCETMHLTAEETEEMLAAARAQLEAAERKEGGGSGGESADASDQEKSGD